MPLFLSTVNQIAFLLVLMFLGYLLTRLKVIPENSATVLSKLENNLFVPALVLSTFIEHFTVERLGTAWKYLLCGFVVISLSVPIALFLARLCSKDDYIKKIFAYGLTFSNFGYFGNAVVCALFPELFMEYLIFSLPFWIFIYTYGVPMLLIPTEEKQRQKNRFSAFFNPMFVAMLVGMLIGISGFKLPQFADTASTSLGSCMSPVAMLLTGMTVAATDLKKTLKTPSIYSVTGLRLLVIPIAAIAVLALTPLSYGIELCIICALSMPLGLNTVVVPGAYGKDTSIAAGMSLVSHTLSCISIPLIILLFDFITSIT